MLPYFLEIIFLVSLFAAPSAALLLSPSLSTLLSSSLFLFFLFFSLKSHLTLTSTWCSKWKFCKYKYKYKHKNYKKQIKILRKNVQGRRTWSLRPSEVVHFIGPKFRPHNRPVAWVPKAPEAMDTHIMTSYSPARYTGDKVSTRTVLLECVHPVLVGDIEVMQRSFEQFEVRCVVLGEWVRTCTQRVRVFYGGEWLEDLTVFGCVEKNPGPGDVVLAPQVLFPKKNNGHVLRKDSPSVPEFITVTEWWTPLHWQWLYEGTHQFFVHGEGFTVPFVLTLVPVPDSTRGKELYWYVYVNGEYARIVTSNVAPRGVLTAHKIRESAVRQVNVVVKQHCSLTLGPDARKWHSWLQHFTIDGCHKSYECVPWTSKLEYIRLLGVEFNPAAMCKYRNKICTFCECYDRAKLEEKTSTSPEVKALLLGRVEKMIVSPPEEDDDLFWDAPTPKTYVPTVMEMRNRISAFLTEEPKGDVQNWLDLLEERGFLKLAYDQAAPGLNGRVCHNAYGPVDDPIPFYSSRRKAVVVELPEGPVECRKDPFVADLVPSKPSKVFLKDLTLSKVSKPVQVETLQAPVQPVVLLKSEAGHLRKGLSAESQAWMQSRGLLVNLAPKAKRIPEKPVVVNQTEPKTSALSEKATVVVPHWTTEIDYTLVPQHLQEACRFFIRMIPNISAEQFNLLMDRADHGETLWWCYERKGFFGVGEWPDKPYDEYWVQQGKFVKAKKKRARRSRSKRPAKRNVPPQKRLYPKVGQLLFAEPNAFDKMLLARPWKVKDFKKEPIRVGDFFTFGEDRDVYRVLGHVLHDGRLRPTFAAIGEVPKPFTNFMMDHNRRMDGKLRIGMLMDHNRRMDGKLRIGMLGSGASKGDGPLQPFIFRMLCYLPCIYFCFGTLGLKIFVMAMFLPIEYVRLLSFGSLAKILSHDLSFKLSSLVYVSKEKVTVRNMGMVLHANPWWYMDLVYWYEYYRLRFFLAPAAGHRTRRVFHNELAFTLFMFIIVGSFFSVAASACAGPPWRKDINWHDSEPRSSARLVRSTLHPDRCPLPWCDAQLKVWVWKNGGGPPSQLWKEVLADWKNGKNYSREWCYDAEDFFSQYGPGPNAEEGKAYDHEFHEWASDKNFEEYEKTFRTHHPFGSKEYMKAWREHVKSNWRDAEGRTFEESQQYHREKQEEYRRAHEEQKQQRAQEEEEEPVKEPWERNYLLQPITLHAAVLLLLAFAGLFYDGWCVGLCLALCSFVTYFIGPVFSGLWWLIVVGAILMASLHPRRWNRKHPQFASFVAFVVWMTLFALTQGYINFTSTASFKWDSRLPLLKVLPVPIPIAFIAIGCSFLGPVGGEDDKYRHPTKGHVMHKRDARMIRVAAYVVIILCLTHGWYWQEREVMDLNLAIQSVMMLVMSLLLFITKHHKAGVFALLYALAFAICMTDQLRDACHSHYTFFVCAEGVIDSDFMPLSILALTATLWVLHRIYAPSVGRKKPWESQDEYRIRQAHADERRKRLTWLAPSYCFVISLIFHLVVVSTFNQDDSAFNLFLWIKVLMPLLTNLCKLSMMFISIAFGGSLSRLSGMNDSLRLIVDVLMFIRGHSPAVSTVGWSIGFITGLRVFLALANEVIEIQRPATQMSPNRNRGALPGRVIPGTNIPLEALQNQAMSATAATNLGPKMSSIVNRATDAQLTVDVPLTPQELNMVSTYAGSAILNTKTDTTLTDHAVDRACRQIVRHKLEEKLHLTASSRACSGILCVGVSFMELSRYAKSGAHFAVYRYDSADVERTWQPLLSAVSRMISEKGLNVGVRDLSLVDLATLYLRLVGSDANVYALDEYIPPNYLTLVYMDSAYNLKPADHEMNMLRTGAAQSYCLMHTPYALFKEFRNYKSNRYDLQFSVYLEATVFGRTIPIRRVPLIQAAEKYLHSHATLTWNGFSEGHTHALDAWGALPNNAIFHGEIEIGNTIHSRCGEMLVWHSRRLKKGENIDYQYMKEGLDDWIVVEDVSDRYDPDTGLVGASRKKILCPRSEWLRLQEILHNYELKDLTPEAVAQQMNKNMDGIALLSTTLVEKWNFNREDFIPLLTAAVMEARTIKERVEAVVKERGDSAVAIPPLFQLLYTASLGVAWRAVKKIAPNNSGRSVAQAEPFALKRSDMAKHGTCIHQVRLDRLAGSSSSCWFCRRDSTQLFECVKGSLRYTVNRSEREGLDVRSALKTRAGIAAATPDLASAMDYAADMTPLSGIHTCEMLILAGGPGAGKSHTIRSIFDEKRAINGLNEGMVVSPFNRLRRDYDTDVEFNTRYCFKTHHVAFRESGKKILAIEEYQAQDKDLVDSLILINRPDLVIVAGDAKQIGLLPGEGKPLKEALDLKTRAHHVMIKNFRNPSDTVALLNRVYGYKMQCVRLQTHGKEQSMQIVGGNPRADICMTFTEASERENPGYVSVRSCVGQSVDVANLYISAKDVVLLKQADSAIVAFSRHKVRLNILTDGSPVVAAALAEIGFNQGSFHHTEEEAKPASHASAHKDVEATPEVQRLLKFDAFDIAPKLKPLGSLVGLPKQVKIFSDRVDIMRKFDAIPYNLIRQETARSGAAKCERNIRNFLDRVNGPCVIWYIGSAPSDYLPEVLNDYPGAHFICVDSRPTTGAIRATLRDLGNFAGNPLNVRCRSLEVNADDVLLRSLINLSRTPYYRNFGAQCLFTDVRSNMRLDRDQTVLHDTIKAQQWAQLGWDFADVLFNLPEKVTRVEGDPNNVRYYEDLVDTASRSGVNFKDFYYGADMCRFPKPTSMHTMLFSSAETLAARCFYDFANPIQAFSGPVSDVINAIRHTRVKIMEDTVAAPVRYAPKVNRICCNPDCAEHALGPNSCTVCSRRCDQRQCHTCRGVPFGMQGEIGRTVSHVDCNCHSCFAQPMLVGTHKVQGSCFIPKQKYHWKIVASEETLPSQEETLRVWAARHGLLVPNQQNLFLNYFGVARNVFNFWGIQQNFDETFRNRLTEYNVTLVNFYPNPNAPTFIGKGEHFLPALVSRNEQLLLKTFPQCVLDIEHEYNVVAPYGGAMVLALDSKLYYGYNPRELEELLGRDFMDALNCSEKATLYEDHSSCRVSLRAAGNTNFKRFLGGAFAKAVNRKTINGVPVSDDGNRKCDDPNCNKGISARCGHGRRHCPRHCPNMQAPRQMVQAGAAAVDNAQRFTFPAAANAFIVRGPADFVQLYNEVVNGNRVHMAPNNMADFHSTIGFIRNCVCVATPVISCDAQCQDGALIAWDNTEPFEVRCALGVAPLANPQLLRMARPGGYRFIAEWPINCGRRILGHFGLPGPAMNVRLHDLYNAGFPIIEKTVAGYQMMGPHATYAVFHSDGHVRLMCATRSALADVRINEITSCVDMRNPIVNGLEANVEPAASEQREDFVSEAGEQQTSNWPANVRSLIPKFTWRKQLLNVHEPSVSQQVIADYTCQLTPISVIPKMCFTDMPLNTIGISLIPAQDMRATISGCALTEPRGNTGKPFKLWAYWNVAEVFGNHYEAKDPLHQISQAQRNLGKLDHTMLSSSTKALVDAMVEDYFVNFKSAAKLTDNEMNDVLVKLLQDEKMAHVSNQLAANPAGYGNAWNKIRFAIKACDKPVNNSKGVDIAHVGQSTSEMNRLTLTVFRAVWRLITLVDEKTHNHPFNVVVTDNGRSPKELAAIVQEVMKDFTEDDIAVGDARSFDRGQNAVTRYMEEAYLRRMGIDEEIIRIYFSFTHHCPLANGLIQGVSGETRPSGFPDTLTGNGIVARLIANWYIRGTGKKVLVSKGDDITVIQKFAHAISDNVWAIDLAVPNLKYSFKFGGDVEFCGLTFFKGQIVPNVRRIFAKAYAKRHSSYMAYLEYATSLKDQISYIEEIGEMLCAAALTDDAHESIEERLRMINWLKTYVKMSRRQFRNLHKKKVQMPLPDGDGKMHATGLPDVAYSYQELKPRFEGPDGQSMVTTEKDMTRSLRNGEPLKTYAWNWLE